LIQICPTNIDYTELEDRSLDLTLDTGDQEYVTTRSVVTALVSAVENFLMKLHYELTTEFGEVPKPNDELKLSVDLPEDIVDEIVEQSRFNDIDALDIDAGDIDVNSIEMPDHVKKVALSGNIGRM
jgi:hypothetical protein